MHPQTLFKHRYGIFRSMIRNSKKDLIVYMTPEGYVLKMFQGEFSITR